jgi:hypothetical protein
MNGSYVMSLPQAQGAIWIPQEEEQVVKPAPENTKP